MEKIEVLATEQEFLDSMVNLNQYVPLAKGQDNYLGKDKYNCDPCDACGPSACADCSGCVLS